MMIKVVKRWWLNTPASETASILLIGTGFGLVLLTGLQTLEDYPTQNTGTQTFARIK